MKKYLLLVLSSIVLLIALDGVALWSYYVLYLRNKDAKQEEKKEEKRVEADDEGGANIVKLDDDTCMRLGISWTKKPKAGQFQPEILAYGRLVDDPTQTFTLRAPMAGVLGHPNGHEWPMLGTQLTDSFTVATLKPRYTPTDLVDLRNKLANAQSEVKAATANLVAARAARDRNEQLRTEGLAQAQTVTDCIAKCLAEEAHLRAAEEAVKLYESALSAAGNAKDQLPLVLAKGGEVEEVLVQPGEAVESGQPILKVRRFERALARVEVPLGEPVPRDTKTARITVVGQHDELLAGNRIAVPPIDPKTGAQAFLFAIPGNPTLRPGMPVVARVEIPGEPRQGFIIPSSAIVRFGGAAWVYVKKEEELETKPEDKPKDDKPKDEKAASAPEKHLNEFQRLEVTLDHPTEIVRKDENDKEVRIRAWFVTKGLDKKDMPVLKGAHLLLSEELKAMIPAGD